MAHNLMITVPDELWAAISKWRSRLHLAKICQDALEAEVHKLENVPKEVKQMEDVIERLRKEAKDFENESYAEGYARGTEWAKEAKYSELREYASMREMLRERLLPGFNILSEEEWDVKKSSEEDAETSWDGDQYQLGWLAAVVDFWDTVADKI